MLVLWHCLHYRRLDLHTDGQNATQMRAQSKSNICDSRFGKERRAHWKINNGVPRPSRVFHWGQGPNAESGDGFLRRGSNPLPHGPTSLGVWEERCELPQRADPRTSKGYPRFSALIFSPDTITLLIVNYHAHFKLQSKRGGGQSHGESCPPMVA